MHGIPPRIARGVAKGVSPIAGWAIELRLVPLGCPSASVHGADGEEPKTCFRLLLRPVFATISGVQDESFPGETIANCPTAALTVEAH